VDKVLAAFGNMPGEMSLPSAAIMSKVSSKDKELFRIPGGHIGINGRQRSGLSHLAAH
jgi:hypothetical protein